MHDTIDQPRRAEADDATRLAQAEARIERLESMFNTLANFLDGIGYVLRESAGDRVVFESRWPDVAEVAAVR